MVVNTPDPGQPNRRRRVPGWLTGRSTPDRLRLLAFVTVLAILATGATAWLLSDRLVDQTTEVSESTGGILISTQQINASLAEAGTAAASVHLAGEDGNPEQRRLYEQAIARAAAGLEDVARLVGDDEPSHDALQAVSADLTRYTAEIDVARLLSIQGDPAADALLVEAAGLNSDEIAPAVQLVSTRARARFADQTSSNWFAFAPVVLFVAVAVVILMMVWMNRRFRRRINLPLALSGLVVAGLAIFSLISFAGQQRALNDAQRDALDAILVSERVQENAFAHRELVTSDVLFGIDGGDDWTPFDQRVTDLFDGANSQADSDRELVGADHIRIRWERYIAETDRIKRALAIPDEKLAQEISQGPANAAFNGFNTTVEAALLDNREQFVAELDEASQSLDYLRGGILLGTLLAAVLAWWGFSLRLGEYR